MTNNYLTGEEIKAYMLDPRECAMCHNCLSVIKGGYYCPEYDCSAIDKVKKLTDKQWDNIARKFKFAKVESIDVFDVWEEVKKRVRKK